MLWKTVAAMAVVTAATVAAAPADARFWQCAPYAREISGVDIRGNARTWWGQAAGRYDRGNTPREGAVMSFPASGRMRMGHVAMVSRVVSPREVRLTHANWSRRGGIERDVRAVDVSAAGDWSRVRVWYAGNGDLGTSSYPVDGFIYADRAGHVPVEAARPLTLAAAAPVPVVPTARAAAFTLDLD